MKDNRIWLNCYLQSWRVMLIGFGHGFIDKYIFTWSFDNKTLIMRDA